MTDPSIDPSATESFDPTLAEGRVRCLPTSDVIDLLHVTHAPERIHEYREAMRRGDRFPPVSVIRVAGHFVVADGHKRLNAYATLGRPDIVVEVWTLRRFLRDQGRQAVANLRKNSAILSRCTSDPRAAGHLLMTTLLHWKRVAISLGTRLLASR